MKSVMASNELSFTDECVFQKVMKDEKICKGGVETILGKKIAKLEYLTDPEEFVFFPEQRHIKLEVLFEGTDKSVNVELKNINHKIKKGNKFIIVLLIILIILIILGAIYFIVL